MNQASRISRIPIHLRIFMVLNFFGQGSYQTSVGSGYSFASSQPVISRCITEVCEGINSHLSNELIKFPLTPYQRNFIKEGFRSLGYFENCVGIVDGSLIRIVSPPADHPIYPGPVFYCRKNFYAINIQIICDHNKKILSINARYPGSVHDSAIWMMSNVRQQLQRQYINENLTDYLIGDSGYPLEPWLLVPCDNPDPNTPEARFNTALSSIRVYIEHTIGLLKNRFRCIHGHRALHYNPIKVAKIIQSCAVLHNICRHRAVPMPIDEDIPIEAFYPVHNVPEILERNWLNVAERRRGEIINRYFV